ncbi:MAG: spore germination protein [Lachnospiraceae bacterium]|uniref:Spore germination protein n=2 Tax=Hominisplanchenecus murintestinalis TaxID=2941517 RepID=A0AC61R132_9FIRM|nr:spore germination protein [Hominisplanchenecus murintestinalis]MCI9515451.1 spore germination protein [Lachnospiraceae bacterium]RKJ83474.1 spore germination protein [Anaerotruncus sp. 1XD22-93]MCI9662131.1 spore germination protein [Lachnospiraceae bacterium]NBH98949.1 spore germination protein [Lachnospiraceae bacterium]NBI76188.1 spore germination protein [Lachnospiraceae bacterium]
MTCLADNMAYFQEKLNIQKSFDIICRMTMVADHKACFYFIDGFVKDELMEKLIEFFYSITPEDLPEDSAGLSRDAMPYVEVELLDGREEIEANILSGVLCLFIDGYDKCFAIDCRTYPMRSVAEPEKDKVLRGSKDGFVETVVFNTALIRRRIRDPHLVMEMQQAGSCSKTDIVLCYMEDRVDRAFLEEIRNRIQNLQVEALTMNQESLVECLYRRKWFNPFPKVKYTERPDATAASVLEGKIAILVDNSPAAIILPVSIFDIVEEADDFYFPPITGTYLRLNRLFIAILTLLLTPGWILLMQNPEWIPPAFDFIKVEGDIHIPLLFQLLILELGIDGLKLAAINTPNMLTTPLSVIAAIVMGEFAVKSGWFNSETMLYMAFVAVANYTQASYELGYALKFMRIILLVLTAAFNLYGFAAGILLTLLAISCNRTISGKSYLYPLIPFNGKQLARRIFRKRIKSGE